MSNARDGRLVADGRDRGGQQLKRASVFAVISRDVSQFHRCLTVCRVIQRVQLVGGRRSGVRVLFRRPPPRQPRRVGKRIVRYQSSDTPGNFAIGR